MLCCAYPIMIIIGLVYPIFIMIKLFILRRKKQLGNTNILYKYGFFYFAYKKKYYFYDLFVLLRKAIILLIVNILANEIKISSENYPILIVVTLLNICLFMQLLW